MAQVYVAVLRVMHGSTIDRLRLFDTCIIPRRAFDSQA
jgi:hypothetical protein